MIYKIGTKEFTSKIGIKNVVKKMMNKYKVGDYLSKNEHNFMLELLKSHPRAKDKIGNGIMSFFIDNTIYGNKCINILRNDMSKTDFSYYKCIDGTNKMLDIKKACREAIKEDILLFKKKTFFDNNELICPLTKEKITFENCHVDHEDPTFKEIFDEWINTKNIEDIEIGGYEDNSHVKYFIDSNLIWDFRQFHNKKAKLRVTSIKGNLTRKRS